MAYSDSRHDPNRAATISTVALIHLGLGYAIVTGFAGGVIGEAGDTIRSVFIPEEKIEIIPLDPPPVPSAEPREAQEPTITPVPTPWDLPDNRFEVVDVPMRDLLPSGTATTPVPLPEPSATRPAFTPKAAAPRGNSGTWVREADYPSRMVRMEIEGTTAFRLSIAANGKPVSCEITSSSGAEELDRAACNALMKRSAFTPATGEDGQPVAGTFSNRIVWKLPE